MSPVVYIDFTVSDLFIRRCDSVFVPAENQNYIYAKFHFSGIWDGLTKRAIFSMGSITLEPILIENNSCQIPNQFLVVPGIIRVVETGGDRLVTNAALIQIIESNFKEGEPLTPPNPGSVYVQSPGGSITHIRESDADEFQYFARGEWHNINDGEDWIVVLDRLNSEMMALSNALEALEQIVYTLPSPPNLTDIINDINALKLAVAQLQSDYGAGTGIDLSPITSRIDELAVDLFELKLVVAALPEVPDIAPLNQAIGGLEASVYALQSQIATKIGHAPSNGKYHGSKDGNWAVIPMPSADIMFFGTENGTPIATHISPLSSQTVLPVTYFSANPGTWHNLVTFVIASDLHGTELEFIPDNLFTAKFWIRSDMLRTGALFRLTASNVRTGDSLATGTASVNLGQTGELQPVIITGLYETPAVVPAEDIRMTLHVQSPLFGVQLGIYSIPPNEISYISRLISGTTLSAPEEESYPIVYHANLSTTGSQLIIPLSIYGKSEEQIQLRYRYSTTTEIAISIKAAKTSNVVDVKRSTQWGATGVEGSSIDNAVITTTYQTIDSVVYVDSNEMHRIWIRFKDSIDNLWSLYEVCCFCSADARRTDVWVNPVYQGRIGA